MKHILTTLLCLVILITGMAITKTVVSAPIERSQVEEFSTIKSWVDELESYESQGVEDKDNYKRIDVNGYYSYGCMQFQMATFLGYYNQMEGTNYVLYKNITIEEARDLISNCSLQKELATWMIQNNPSNWQHWYHSVENRGLGLPPNA